MEELAQQSKINYTVVADSPYYEYFKNMAGAEEDLYKYVYCNEKKSDKHTFAKATTIISKENFILLRI